MSSKDFGTMQFVTDRGSVQVIVPENIVRDAFAFSLIEAMTRQALEQIGARLIDRGHPKWEEYSRLPSSVLHEENSRGDGR